MTAHDRRTVRHPGARRTPLGPLLRVSAAVVAVGSLLTACTAPNGRPDWRAHAIAARPATDALSAYDFTAHAGFTVIGDRFLDRCGEIASEQGGRRDDDADGHACTAVRTVVLTDHASATTARTPGERMGGLLDVIGLGAPLPGEATTNVDYQLDPVDGVRHQVRGFTGTIGGPEPIEMFDDAPPWLHDPDIIDESTEWSQAILDDPGAFPRQAIIIAVSATYFDSTRN